MLFLAEQRGVLWGKGADTGGAERGGGREGKEIVIASCIVISAQDFRQRHPLRHSVVPVVRVLKYENYQ